MVVYNRRKRALFFQEQEQLQAHILQVARDAVSHGTASPAQKALVEGIAEEEHLWQQKKAERKAPSKLLWWLHGEWNEEEELKKQRQLAVMEFQKKEQAANQELGITQAVQDARAGAAGAAPAEGGPLDQAAAKSLSRGWFGFLGGSKKSE